MFFHRRDVFHGKMNRRAFLQTGAAIGLASVSGCLETSSSAISDGTSVGLRLLTEGMNQPLGLEATTDNEQRYVADKLGTIHLLTPDGDLREFLQIGDRMAEVEHWEMGLLGIELHPEFEDNGRFYVRYSAPPNENTPDRYSHTFALSEFRASQDLQSADPESERRILEIPEPGPSHNAGSIEFGPDAHLYVAVGDGGPANQDTGYGHVDDWFDDFPGGNGQDVTENLLGSILRIDVDGSADGKSYGIPSDNPLVGTAGLDEHYAWGLRNPYRMTFDDEQLIVADAGSSFYEEVNVVESGGNYGWNVREGRDCQDPIDTRKIAQNPFRLFEKPVYGLELLDTFLPVEVPYCPTSTPDGKPLRDPVISYPHERNGEQIGTAVVGGQVYDNDAIPELRDKYVFADLMAGRSGQLYASDPQSSEESWPMERIQIAGRENGEIGEAILSVEKDANGELCVLTTQFAEGTGKVYRVTSPS